MVPDSPENDTLGIYQQLIHRQKVISDIAMFVLKRDVKLQLTN